MDKGKNDPFGTDKGKKQISGGSDKYDYNYDDFEED